MSGAEKFGGISYSTRGNLSRDIKSNESYGRISEYSLNKLKKENPALLAKASENLKKKRYANTYNNINAEIDKIKKKEPEWVEEQRKIQLEINLRNSRIKSEQLKKKHNIHEFDKDLIHNPKYKTFVEINKKTNKRQVLTQMERRIRMTPEYQDWKKKFDIEVEKFNQGNTLGYIQDLNPLQ